jgi:hypothetical protein
MPARVKWPDSPLEPLQMNSGWFPSEVGRARVSCRGPGFAGTFALGRGATAADGRRFVSLRFTPTLSSRKPADVPGTEVQ